jgi:hypothetical protein
MIPRFGGRDIVPQHLLGRRVDDVDCVPGVQPRMLVVVSRLALQRDADCPLALLDEVWPPDILPDRRGSR